MKKYISPILFALLLLPGLACKKGFFDQVPNDRLTIDETFTNRATAERFLANVYSFIPDENGQRGVPGGRGAGTAGPWTGASDEAEYVWSFVRSNDMNIGNWDANSSFVNDFWLRFYRGIRNASFFIENVNKVQDLDAGLMKQYIAEARALRAMYYFYLMRMYGPVVLIGDRIIAPDAPFDDVQLPRNSFDECVAFVTSELAAAAADLPTRVTSDQNTGRLTKGIALAFRIEALTFAASPLFNGNTDYATLKNPDGKQLISQTYDANKWKAAADAAKAFIGEFVPGTYNLYRKSDANGFNPYLSFRDVMLDGWNSEVILGRPDSDVQSRQYEETPYHNGRANEVRGSGGLGATQNLVDAYFMKDGLPITSSPLYQSSGFTNFRAPYDDQARSTFNPWVDREPRFYVAITYSGSKWLNTNTGTVITELWANGNSGRVTGNNDYSPTGYIMRRNMSLGNWNVGGRSLVLLRLAQVYLNYIEALNESTPGDPDILRYLNMIRDRAGIPAYGTIGVPVPAGQAAMRDAIRAERRVELAFENSRYFDTRRWKIAEQTDGGPMRGLNITQNLPAFYNVVTFENRVFNKRHYLFPIPQSDVNINRQMVQNTGW